MFWMIDIIMVVQFMTLVKENPFSLKLERGWNFTNVIFYNYFELKNPITR